MSLSMTQYANKGSDCGKAQLSNPDTYILASAASLCATNQEG